MTDAWTGRLSEYIDDELDADTRRALETHLATCADCRAVRAELERVVARARAVGYRAPATDLWVPIETTIRGTRSAKPGRFVTLSWTWLAVAAAVVALVAGAFAWTIASRREPSGASAIARDTTPTAPVSVEGASALAVASYREAAGDLERAFEAGRGTLKPETTRIIEENLRAIDVAIAQTDSALRRDPGSAYLNQYLAATMQRKLRLLRRAVEITSARS